MPRPPPYTDKYRGLGIVLEICMRDSEPNEPTYTGDISYCGICDVTLRTDDPRDQSKTIDGLGFVCLTCFLKEEESQALNAIKDLK